MIQINNDKTSLSESVANVISTPFPEEKILPAIPTLEPEEMDSDEEPEEMDSDEEPTLEPEEMDSDEEPTEEEENVVDITEYDKLNKLWKINRLNNVNFGQQASLDRKGKKIC
jgi:hypothetical protein